MTSSASNQVGITMAPISVAVATAATHMALVMPARLSQQQARRVDIGSRPTLLVLHFLIEFTNIRAQYCP